MSWSKTFTIHPCKDVRREDLIEKELYALPIDNVLASQQAAVNDAAKRLALCLEVPNGYSICICAAGHLQSAAPGSMPDSISVSLNVIKSVV